MSQRNVETVRATYIAFNQRDLKTLADLSHDSFEFVSALSAVDKVTYHGKHAWADYFSTMDQAWKRWRTEDFKAFEAGEDRVVALLRLIGEGAGSGASLEREIGMVYELRDAKVRRLRSYLDPREAFDAVGLSE